MRPLHLLCMTSLVLCFSAAVTSQQIEVPRVSQMPNMPSSYDLRDWKGVARKYDSLVFDLNAEGEFFPIVTLGMEGVNYPDIEPVFMDSYVGSSTHGQQREAINIIPAIVGATLVGADKSTQFGVDWVSKVKDFYNLKNNELVYLNGPSDKSGHDWWYETMPNVFFYQLYNQYPDVDGFEEQFISVADRWLMAVEAMGGDDAPWSVPSMNYRAWSLKDMAPLTGGVKEPEAAGAIAWILYQAFQYTSDEKYLTGAQWALDFLNAQASNPSYELQLPYGVLTAAKLNAVFGASYDVEKMLNWCFDKGDLRGWGSVLGTWGGEDVHGLIGEANDQGNDYVFIMNGFQQAAALAPLVKYDKRFATAIAKWMLNVSNASRLFYSGYLRANQQSDYEWCNANDPHSVIAYEAIKEKWEGTELYARGDSKDAGWADTDLALYGSSHVGYLGALIEPTDVEGILQIDVNVTDFYNSNDFPTYLYFNPHAEERAVTIQVGSTPKDIYDAISETIIESGASGSQLISIPAAQSMLISLLPSDIESEVLNGRLMVGESVVDYHYGYDFTPKLRIKSLAASADLLEIGSSAEIFCTVSGASEATYEWFINDELSSTTSGVLHFSPSEPGEVAFRVVVASGTETVTDSLKVQVVELIPEPPVISSISSEKKWYRPGGEFWTKAVVHDPKGLDLTYEWTVEGGSILQISEDSILVKADGPGLTSFTLKASNYAEATTAIHSVLVVDEGAQVDALLQLPMNETALDQSVNHFSTQLSGGVFTAGPTAEAFEALRLSSVSDEVLVVNHDLLNFRDEIGISLWVYFTDFSEERFLISHGSWEKRWKLSTTENKKLRWTVNTSDGIKDLDSSIELESDRWYYVAVAYDGHSMQLYLDGELDAFSLQTGQINQSDVGISLGKRLPGDNQYNLRGTIDEVRLYNQSFDPDQVATLMNQWSPKVITGFSFKENMIYPNPASSFVNIPVVSGSDIEIYNLGGLKIKSIPTHQAGHQTITLELTDFVEGIYLVRMSNTQPFQKLVIRK